MKRLIIGFTSVNCCHCLHRDECKLKLLQKETAEEIFKANLKIEEHFDIELICNLFALDERSIKHEWELSK